MPIVTIQSPTGASFQIDAPEGATDDQIFRFAKSQGLFDEQQQAQTQQQQAINQDVPDGGQVSQAQLPASFGEQIAGGLEAAATLGSSIIAEPIAGLAGLGAAINPFNEEGAGGRRVKEVREALTFEPTLPGAKAVLAQTGEIVKPVGEFLKQRERNLGEFTFQATGSPALAAMASSLPTVALELLGIKGAKRFTSPDLTPSGREIKRAVVESSPEIEQLKDASRAVYKEIDDSGVTVKAESFNRLANDIKDATSQAGRDVDVTPKAEAAIRRLDRELGQAKTLGEIDTIRTVVQGVANQLDSTEKSLGNIMIAEIDSFLDNLKAKDLTGGTQKAADTGKKFKAARKLWGRARRAELIQDAITTGESRAAGAEAGIRNEFNRILNNKKLRKFIPAEEQAIMRAVVDGDFTQNLTRLIGRVGLSIDRSPNVFGSIVAGGGLGTVLGGSAGAIAVPVIGTISKQIAKKITTNKARFTDSIIRAGVDGERIVKAYLSAVPKAKRSIEDLADLLSDPNINIDDLEFIANKTVQDALELAKGKRAINLAAGASTGALAQQTKIGEQQQ